MKVALTGVTGFIGRYIAADLIQQGHRLGCWYRPTGVYGIAHPIQDSRWFDLVSGVVRGETVTCQGGGKEVHAADVAKAVRILLAAEGVAGEAYNCYDRYVHRHPVSNYRLFKISDLDKLLALVEQVREEVLSGALLPQAERRGSDSLVPEHVLVPVQSGLLSVLLGAARGA